MRNGARLAARSIEALGVDGDAVVIGSYEAIRDVPPVPLGLAVLCLASV